MELRWPSIHLTSATPAPSPDPLNTDDLELEDEYYPGHVGCVFDNGQREPGSVCRLALREPVSNACITMRGKNG